MEAQFSNVGKKRKKKTLRFFTKLQKNKEMKIVRKKTMQVRDRQRGVQCSGVPEEETKQ